MLKYVGEFDKLKDYGFIKLAVSNKWYKVITNIDDEYWQCEIVIDNGIIKLDNEQHEEYRDLYNLDTLYDLIKDGLVIKEEL